MKKKTSNKIVLGIFKICKYTFLYLKKRIIKKIGLYFMRFLSIPFLVFEKGDKWKNSLGLFKICKYTFLYLKKKISKKIGLYILRFVSIVFLVFEKTGSAKKLG